MKKAIIAATAAIILLERGVKLVAKRSRPGGGCDSMGYVGAYAEDATETSDGAVKLLLFDIEVRPSMLFETPRPFRSFDVDWQDRKVPILTSGENSRVEVYSFV